MADVKQLWGVEFNVVAEGLDEDEVVSYVNTIRADQARQASLQKLAEQTVVEGSRPVKWCKSTSSC